MGGVANRFSVLIGGTILCGLAGGMANLALAAVRSISYMLPVAHCCVVKGSGNCTQQV